MQLPILTFFTTTNLFPDWGKTTSLLATATETESGSLVLAGVLLSLVVVYLASKLGGLSNRVGLPPVLLPRFYQNWGVSILNKVRLFLALLS